MRLIDAEALFETIEQHHYRLSSYTNSTDYGMFTLGIKQAIDEQPVAAVRCPNCGAIIGLESLKEKSGEL